MIIIYAHKLYDFAEKVKSWLPTHSQNPLVKLCKDRIAITLGTGPSINMNIPFTSTGKPILEIKTYHNFLNRLGIKDFLWFDFRQKRNVHVQIRDEQIHCFRDNRSVFQFHLIQIEWCEGKITRGLLMCQGYCRQHNIFQAHQRDINVTSTWNTIQKTLSYRLDM